MRRTYGSKTILYGTMKFAVSGDFFLKMMNHVLKVLRSSSIQLGSGVKLYQPS